MVNFSLLLSGLQAAIAARAARDRRLTVLLVALWGRIARMGTRLERLVALWRAGSLPAPRAPRLVRGACAGGAATDRVAYPTAPGWLVHRLGHEGVAYGLQLRHLLTDEECAAFLAACSQAGRVLRPLLRMLSIDPLPEVIRAVRRGVLAVVPAVAGAAWVGGLPGSQFLDG